MNTKEIKEYKKNLKLSKRQRNILVGLLLGDGHLETQNDGRTYRLKVEHGMHQVDYTQWLYQEFKEWARSRPRRKIRNDGQESVGFSTLSHSAFRFYAHQFYVDKRKRIPKLIHKLLTPISVAVWYMDDGSRKSLRHKTYVLHTLGYTKKDLEVAQEALKKCFELNTKLHKQKGKYWRIYILSESARNFERLIIQYITNISSMKHKLDNVLPKK